MQSVETKPKGWWQQRYEFLVNLYPQHRPPPGECDAYKEFLRDVPREALSKAILRAPEESPTFFPSAGKLRELAMRIDASDRAAERARQFELMPRDEPSMPDEPLSPNNPFQQLAERWERESADLGIRDNDAIPRHLGVARLRELNAMLERHWGGANG